VHAMFLKKIKEIAVAETTQKQCRQILEMISNGQDIAEIEKKCQQMIEKCNSYLDSVFSF